MGKEIKKYDKNGNLVYKKDSNFYNSKHWYKDGNEIHFKKSSKKSSYEYWNKYDKNNNQIYHKDNQGLEFWCKYDKNNNQIHYKNTFGEESWYEYDENNNEIHYKDEIEEHWYKYETDIKYNKIEITEKEYKEIEKRKEYLSREKVTRFKIMEI